MPAKSFKEIKPACPEALSENAIRLGRAVPDCTGGLGREVRRYRINAGTEHEIERAIKRPPVTQSGH